MTSQPRRLSGAGSDNTRRSRRGGQWAGTRRRSRWMSTIAVTVAALVFGGSTLSCTANPVPAWAAGLNPGDQRAVQAILKVAPGTAYNLEKLTREGRGPVLHDNQSTFSSIARVATGPLAKGYNSEDRVSLVTELARETNHPLLIQRPSRGSGIAALVDYYLTKGALAKDAAWTAKLVTTGGQASREGGLDLALQGEYTHPRDPSDTRSLSQRAIQEALMALGRKIDGQEYDAAAEAVRGSGELSTKAVQGLCEYVFGGLYQSTEEQTRAWEMITAAVPSDSRPTLVLLHGESGRPSHWVGVEDARQGYVGLRGVVDDSRHMVYYLPRDEFEPRVQVVVAPATKSESGVG